MSVRELLTTLRRQRSEETMTDTTTEKYFKIIDRCAQNKENFEISNGSATHAAYLLKTFFKYADKEVSIFTGELFTGVFDDPDLRKYALSFMAKDGTSLSIIYQDEVPQAEILGRAFIKDICALNTRKGKLSVYTQNGTELQGIPHFAVMDQTGYRIEINHLERMAEANFGDTDKAPKISAAFNRMASKAKKVFDLAPNN